VVYLSRKILAVIGMEVFENFIPSAHEDCISIAIANSFIRQFASDCSTEACAKSL